MAAMALSMESTIGVGSLVEISGLSSPVKGKEVRLPDVDGSQAKYKDIDPEELEGKVGICIGFSDEKFEVKTFENVIVSVPMEYVRDYYPPDTLEGGFDLIWPADGAFSMSMGSAILSVLADKGYCMVQMFLSEMDAKTMSKEAGEMPRQYRMKREIENAYLGLESSTKVALRPHDTPAVKVTDAMTSCDRHLTNIAVSIGSLSPMEVGFQVKSRTNAFIRIPYTNAMEQSEISPESLSTIDEVDEWDGDITGYIRFTQERTISMIHMVHNEGGRVFLYPRDSKGESIQFPISPNKMLIFRHDLLDYSYQPLGKSLALQAWINKDRNDQKAITKVEIDFDKGLATLNPGRQLPAGIPAHVLALHAKMPMDVENEWMWWMEFVAGTDGCTQWPALRWPTEPYFQEGDEAMSTGKSYTKHGGFVSHPQVTEFDNKFFGIDELEAKHMIPGQRWCVEVGYKILTKSGFNKQSLENAQIGVWVGDVGPDWHSGQNFWPWNFLDTMAPEDMAMCVHSHVTASRLPYMYGFRGPTSSYDTACSASLVAMNAAHTFMMNDDHKEYGNKNLVMGWNALLWPVSFIGNCAAGMLSHVGRCFTFNRAADGYQRGEGCGGVFLQRLCTEEQIKNRQGAIIGTATNQDGRSASITAPNGPSQTAVIKKSMAFAGIDVNTVGMAECHGTGTALGDPIEVGALQAVMRARIEPILKVSTKSHVGHLEAGAGIAGLTKCIMMIRACTSPANAHFNVINPNLMTEGYPVYFTNEITDTGYSSGYCGVSSFGFGGTNSRCDVYNECDVGARKTVKIELPALALPTQIFDDESAVSICGTWNNWEADRMDEEEGALVYRVTLGATRVERFHLTTGDDDLVLYPGVHMAGPSEQILGPDRNNNGRAWVIDGREDGMSAGTVYEIRFHHDSTGKHITWQPVAMSIGDASRTDSMYIYGTFNNQAMQPMKAVTDVPGTYEVQFQIGPRGIDYFQFLINKDKEQCIYAGPSMSVCGPDSSAGEMLYGGAQMFSVSGPQFQLATVKLMVRDGQITVTSHTERQGDRTWGDANTFSISAAHSYFLVSSADDFRVYHPMTAEPDSPGIFKACITLVHIDGNGACESFQLNMNKDDTKTLYPSSTGAVQGPALDEEGRCWTIFGGLGETYEITIDVNALNRATMIDWHLV